MTLEDELIESLAPRARSVSLADGEVLVEQGDAADKVYFIQSGRMSASKSTGRGDVVVGTVEAGHVIGEVTVVAGGLRTATLTASGPVEVLEIERVDFEDWLNSHPEMADRVSDEARERVDRTNVATMIAELMGSTDHAIVQQVVDRVDWRRLEAGEVLFEQGDVADAAYFVVGGRVTVHVVDDEGEERLVAELGRGEVVGELGLLDRAPRSATVRAVRDTTLASFSAATFEELVATSPAMMLNVTRRILLRLRSPSQRRFDRASSLTVAVTARCDAGALVAEMAAEIARFGSTKHLSSDRVDRVLNRTAISQASTDNVGVPRLAEFMHEADVGNDHVLLQTDAEMTAWTRRSLRQADRVVVVCSPNPDAAECALISEIFATIADAGHVARMLAVLHPASTERPRRTADLLARWRIDDVVHVRSGSAEDVARLARLASGHGYGLVLSGGGARGFAHLGVLRALTEQGVPVDKVAGCSMGTVIAAGIALGPRGEELLALAEGQSHRLLDYTIPVVSLLKGGRITRNIEQTFDDRDIEDLWLPFYCVSTNLTKSRLEVHRRGNMALAVRASLAIPGVLPPVPYDGDLLVDGGVLNNLPFEVMRDDSTVGTIVAVDVAPDLGPRAHSDFGMSVSGVRALWASITPGRSEFPSATSVLLRSMMTGSVRNQRESMQAGSIDLLVTLHLPGIGMLEFERTREVAEAGYEASKATVTEWAATRTELGVA
ncbi:MAG TPA: cyclic nucleotide-binding domain-containing protein [Ilumatobacteraceae bacterium]|nr:cyclic nucleotide-binding domain-containing protein [Ilumatobacteraceae bacterium]